jgi:RNA polymerase sigma-70 factor (ECF subfamily)
MLKYWKLVVVLSANRVRDRRDAEDITQEAFFRAFRALDTLSEPVAFLGWLLRIAQNVATDHLRSRRSVVSLDAIGEAPRFSGTSNRGTSVPRHSWSDQDSSFAQQIEAREDAEEALEALDTLPEKYKEVVTLRYLRGFDGKTMAKLLGEPEGTIRNRLFRGLEKLRSVLETKRAHKT